MKENARKDAEIIIFEAEKEAERLLKEAAQKATEINRETDVLKKETRMFRQRLQIMVESQLEMIKNEEWDLLLNSHSKIEVFAPSIESILAGRAKKNEQLIKQEVTPTFTLSVEESNPNTQEIILPTDEVITVGGFE